MPAKQPKSPILSRYFYEVRSIVGTSSFAEVVGPMSFDDLKQLATQGTITPQTLVRRDNQDDWRSADQFRFLCEAMAVQLDRATTSPLNHPDPSVTVPREVEPVKATSPKRYFYQRMGEVAGPAPAAELKQFAANGVITPETWIRREDHDDWHRAAQFKFLFEAMAVLSESALPVTQPPEATKTLKRYFYQVMGDVVGPISVDELKQLAFEGTITPEALVRREDHDDWHLADRFRFLSEAMQLQQDTATAAAKISPQYFYHINGEVIGPCSVDEIKLHAAKGFITPETLIRREGDNDWHLTGTDTYKGLLPVQQPITTLPRPSAVAAISSKPLPPRTTPNNVGSPQGAISVGIGIVFCLFMIVMCSGVSDTGSSRNSTGTNFSPHIPEDEMRELKQRPSLRGFSDAEKTHIIHEAYKLERAVEGLKQRRGY